MICSLVSVRFMRIRLYGDMGYLYGKTDSSQGSKLINGDYIAFADADTRKRGERRLSQ